MVRLEMAIVLLFGFGLAACGGGSTTPAPPEEGKVTLAITPSKTTYAADETVELLVTLSNGTDDVVALGNLPAGVLQPVTMLVDGSPVASKEAPFDADNDLGVMLEASLRSIPAGEDLTFTLASDVDDDLGGPVFRLLAENGYILECRYRVGAPGAYALTLEYQYLGPVPTNMGTVLTSKTNAATASFTRAAP